MISASGEVGISVMVELCQRVLDEKGMPDEWQTSVLEANFQEKGRCWKFQYLQISKAAGALHKDR